MEFDWDQFLAEYRSVLHEAGRLAAEEKNVEDERKRQIAGLISSSQTKSFEKAQQEARCHRDIDALDTELAALRTKAAAAAAEARWYEVRWETWRTRQATWRANMAKS